MLSWDNYIYWSEVGLTINDSVFNHILWDLLNTKLINKQKLYLIKGRGREWGVSSSKKLFQHLIRCFFLVHLFSILYLNFKTIHISC